MAKKYDGWILKDSTGYMFISYFRPTRTEVVKMVNDGEIDPSMLWRNWGRRTGHEIVKVKLVEVSDE